MIKNILNNDKKRKKIPPKNYVIILIIFIVSIAIVFFMRNWYQSYQDYKKTIPILKGFISEVRNNEINSYLNDNPSAIVYIGVAEDENCRQVESELKQLIQKKHLKDKVIYYNISDVSNKEEAINDFNKQYAQNDKIGTYPAIVILEEGSIVAERSRTKDKNLSINEIQQLFDEYEITGD